jgi:hypothetical protein
MTKTEIGERIEKLEALLESNYASGKSTGIRINRIKRAIEALRGELK